MHFENNFSSVILRFRPWMLNYFAIEPLCDGFLCRSNDYMIQLTWQKPHSGDSCTKQEYAKHFPSHAHSISSTINVI